MFDLLAVANNYRQWSRSMGYAAALCRHFDASLTGIFVSEPIVPIPAMNMPLTFPEMYTISGDAARDACAAGPEFLRWAAARGVTRAQWIVAEGYLEQTLAQAANWHDLMVLESGSESPLGAPGTLGQIVLTCGVPCLLIPDSYAGQPAYDTIAIAWNGSVESVRALHAALPLLRRARSLVLIHGERSEPFSSVDWKPPFTLDGYLAQHRLEATHRRCEAKADASGAELLRIAQDTGADMLVMGAYGRSRFSEWMLGGATRHVFEAANLPVLMRH